MKLTQEQIVKLIADAFRVGRAEGYEVGQKDGYADGLLDGDAEGYERGWSDGWDEGYAKAEEDAEDAAEEDDGVCGCPQCTGIDEEEEEDEDEDEDEEDEEEMSSKEFYAAGWKDGYCGKDLDSTRKEDKVYLWGYQDGREEYCREDGEEES